VLQRSGRQKVRERAQISYKYFAEAANAACPGANFSWAFRVLFLMFPDVSGSRRQGVGYPDGRRDFMEREGNMKESALRAEELRAPQDDPRLQDLVAEFREMLPGRCATAQAIDRKEPWEQIALKAVEDGYIELADQFDGFVEVCLRDASRARQARHPKIP